MVSLPSRTGLPGPEVDNLAEQKANTAHRCWLARGPSAIFGAGDQQKGEAGAGPPPDPAGAAGSRVCFLAPFLYDPRSQCTAVLGKPKPRAASKVQHFPLLRATVQVQGSLHRLRALQ